MKKVMLVDMINEVIFDETILACIRIEMGDNFDAVIAADGILRGYMGVARTLLKKGYLVSEIAAAFKAFVSRIEEAAKNGGDIPYFNYGEDLAEIIEGRINGTVARRFVA